MSRAPPPETAAFGKFPLVGVEGKYLQFRDVSSSLIGRAERGIRAVGSMCNASERFGRRLSLEDVVQDSPWQRVVDVYVRRAEH